MNEDLFRRILQSLTDSHRMLEDACRHLKMANDPKHDDREKLIQLLRTISPVKERQLC